MLSYFLCFVDCNTTVIYGCHTTVTYNCHTTKMNADD